MKLETDTSAAKTIQAYKDAASQIGLVLEPGNGSIDNGDFPRHAYTNLRYIRRVNAVGKEYKKTIRSMSRQLVTTKDDKGHPTRIEFLTYQGRFSAPDHRGIERGADFEIGKYQKPKIVPNSNVKYNQDTGEPIGPEKILSGVEIVFEIEVPKSKEARKKLIDSILGDENHPDNVLYYVRHLDSNNYEVSRDASFTYSDFVDYTIDELRDLSQRGSGSKSSPYYKDKDGQLRYKKNDSNVHSKDNKAVYQ